MDDAGPGHRVETADFAPVRLAAPRRRLTAAVAAAWVLGFVGVVALAALPRPAPDGAALAARSPDRGVAVTAAPVSSPAAPGDSMAPAQGAAAPTPAPLAVVVRPVGDAVAVTGMVLVREVTSVSISVLGPHDLPLAVRSVSVADPDGGIRPSRARAFSIRIDLPSASQAAAVDVEIEAYDALGTSIGEPLLWLGGQAMPCGPGWPCGGTGR